MEWLNGNRKNLMLVGVAAAVVLAGSGVAKSDFFFGEPTNLGPIVNSSTGDNAPYISADGLALYFHSDRAGGYGERDLWMTTRPTTNDEWTDPVNLGPTVNSSAHDAAPCISADGLALYFQSERAGGGYGESRDLWMTTRPTINDMWTEPVNLGPTVNSSERESRPCISSDNLSLFFNSDRAGGFGSQDLYVATRVTVQDEWGPPSNLGPTVNSANSEFSACISADGLWLFFASSRPGGYGGNNDLWVTIRTTTSDPWSNPVNLGPTVNSSSNEPGLGISADGQTIYLYSDRPGGVGGHDIWQAQIAPIVDLNGDGIVDSADMCAIVDHWGEDYSLCDIGPMPWGDGIVDVEDLKVLAEHLFEEVNDPTLLAHWPLDEAQGVITYDNAGDYDGTLVGGPLWQPDGGMVAGALQFDGIDDYVSTDPVLNPADPEISSGFSVVAWAMGGAPGQVVLSQTGAANWLSTDSGEGNLMTELMNSGRSSVGPMLSQVNITDGNWHRIGFVWDGSYRCLYVDGVEVAKDVAPLSDLESAEGGLYFGVGSTLAPGTYFSGLIDEVRIYDRVVAP